MQTPYAWIETTDGQIRSITYSTDDATALSTFHIQWGADQPGDQPDPAVLTIDIIDRDGSLAGDMNLLSGATIRLYLSHRATWADMRTTDAYADATTTWARLNTTVKAIDDPGSDPMLPVLFKGFIGTGGTIDANRDGTWTIHITATSRLVLLKRLQDQGPTSSDSAWAGYHWVGTPKDRLYEIETRAYASNAPIPGDSPEWKDAQVLPPSVRPYDKNDTVSLWDLLTRLIAADPGMPLVSESWVWDDNRDQLHLQPLAAPYSLTLGHDSALPQIQGGTVPCIPASKIRTDDTLTIAIPYASAQIAAYAAGATSGKPTYQDATVQIQTAGATASVAEQNKTLQITSDAITSDTSGGIAGATPWKPTAQQRLQMALWLHDIDTRLTPSMAVDSDDLDPEQWPDLYQPTTPGPVITTPTRYSSLARADTTPAVDGIWTPIGGTLEFGHHADGRPHMRQIWALAPAVMQTAALPWSGLASWEATYGQADLTWHTLAAVTAITN